MTNDAPMRRKTWQKLDTAALDTRLVLMDAPSVAEPQDKPAGWQMWSLFGVSVGACILTACLFWAGPLLR